MTDAIFATALLAAITVGTIVTAWLVFKVLDWFIKELIKINNGD